ncbi:hypothetical protein CC1G_11181 [Coprinopsis cinerea okayama7|uniref:Uncharacterized protein n=1 Tax=Coprinopsis cinerea (strain Okayama-7 / 130 / ATCC MYA-4618 / FGSC 9003) TaxID=240176 RepID=A8P4F0_COPC7|nr:hypothetical protein CC1G_11181 [Coprinopsis cinerea okayama7\|eukprot:XP_001838738.2 hypothetical protein CC1G_11181 [Coprinopsis cinerea okayama7\
MATPTSSATSPSPPMAYLSHTPPTPQPMIMSTTSDILDREQRQKAIQKFLARAELSGVTRALRARLSYASYKATHNIPHVPLRDLEAQSSQNQAASFNRTIAAKRKASGPPQYYYAPSTPGPSSGSPATGNARKGAPGAMLPPSSVNSPRSHYPSINGQPASAAHGEMASSSRHPSSTAPNLYTSILAPPPAKQARTIHNANDPPVPAPTRPAPSPRPRLHKSPRTEVGRSHVKSRHSDKSSKSTSSPDHRRAKRASADKGKRKQASVRVDADGDVDMKAAATLTSLLLHSRPSIGSASSPRSSIDGSETGSTLSYSHFAQSSARTTTGSIGAPSSIPGPSTPSTDAPLRHRTPPPSSAPVQDQITPHAAHSDKEAADLMLFLATSPSPARPSKGKDHAAFQILSGEPTRPKGRVLFQSGSASEQPSGESSGAPAASSLQLPSTLARSGEGSFVSSISSIGSELGGNRDAPSPPTRAISTTPGPQQLLPPPPLSSRAPSAPSSPGMAKQSVPGAGSPRPSSQAPSIDFNIHEFINASPSPRNVVAQGHKPNHSLRADVGRKLFEEEQMRYAAQGMTGMGNPHTVGGFAPQNVEARGESQPIPPQTWNAGINIAQT